MSVSRNREIAEVAHVQGGEGIMRRDLLLTDDQIHGELTYISSLTLDPGCSIGYHQHTGDSEMYYIFEGSGSYTDNGETYPVSAGDVVFCRDGESHGIVNDGDAPLRGIGGFLPDTQTAPAGGPGLGIAGTVIVQIERAVAG